MQNDNHQEQLDDLCRKLNETLGDNHNPQFRLKAISQSLHIVAKNLREAILLPDTNITLTTNQPPPPEQTIPQKLHTYILTHLDEPLPSAKALARLFHTNQRKLKEGFRKEYNTSIYSFFNEQRLEMAKAMIITTHKSIKEIAGDCGFNTYHAFYCAFAKHYGYAPTELRTNNK